MHTGETPQTGASGDEGIEDGDAGTEEEADASSAPGSASEAKAINDAVAFIRGLAELRDRNADWAERAAQSPSAREAAERGVIDFVATSVEDLLAQADGMVVEMSDGTERTLATEGLSIEHVEPDWRTALLATITNPNVALILMLVGVCGLIFEFLNPGALVPGTIGGISLIMGLYSLALLPFDWAGIGLILLGLALIVAEAFAPPSGSWHRGHRGAGDRRRDSRGHGCRGVCDLRALIAPKPVVGALVTYLIVYLTRGSFRARVVSGQEKLVDAKARVIDWHDGDGDVWLHGERWKAEEPRDLGPDDQVRVREVTGLVVRVDPLPKND